MIWEVHLEDMIHKDSVEEEGLILSWAVRLWVLRLLWGSLGGSQQQQSVAILCHSQQGYIREIRLGSLYVFMCLCSCVDVFVCVCVHTGV